MVDIISSRNATVEIITSTKLVPFGTKVDRFEKNEFRRSLPGPGSYLNTDLWDKSPKIQTLKLNNTQSFYQKQKTEKVAENAIVMKKDKFITLESDKDPDDILDQHSKNDVKQGLMD